MREKVGRTIAEIQRMKTLAWLIVGVVFTLGTLADILIWALKLILIAPFVLPPIWIYVKARQVALRRGWIAPQNSADFKLKWAA